jgi:hypothetical protein
MSALPAPPPELSVYRSIIDAWVSIPRRVQRGEDVELDVQGIQARLDQLRKAHDEDRLPKGYNWEPDLRSAEDFHARRTAWIQGDIRSRGEWLNFWQSRVATNSELIAKLALDGIKLILLAHGAIAVAALSALASANSDRYRAAFLCAMFGAVVGLALVAGGKIALIESTSNFNEKIKGRLTYKRSWLSIQAFSRYGDIYFSRYALWAIRLIYGSLVWCAIYVFFCLVLLANS